MSPKVPGIEAHRTLGSRTSPEATKASPSADSRRQHPLEPRDAIALDPMSARTKRRRSSTPPQASSSLDVGPRHPIAQTEPMAEPPAKRRAIRTCKLAGAEIAATSVAQLQHWIRNSTEQDRPKWNLLALSMLGDRMEAAPNDSSERLESFRHVTSIRDRRVVLGATAEVQPDGRMRLISASVEEPELGSKLEKSLSAGRQVRFDGVPVDAVTGNVAAPVGLDSEAEKVQARLDELEQSVIAVGFGSAIQRAYADTATFLDFWMHKTARGSLLNAQGNVPELLQAFRAYVGERSYLGMNAECVLRALDGDAVRAAPRPRTVDPDRPTWMADPLGLSDAEKLNLNYQSAGSATLVVIEEKWEPLLKLFDRTRLGQLASNANAAPTLRELLSAAPEWQRAGFSDDQIFRIANTHSASQLIKAVTGGLPAIETGRLTLQQMVKAAGTGTQISARAAVNNLLKGAEIDQETRSGSDKLDLESGRSIRGNHPLSTSHPSVEDRTSTQQTFRHGKLNGAPVVEASLRQVQQLMLHGVEQERPIWRALAGSMATNERLASSTDSTGRFAIFGREVVLPDERRVATRLAAAQQPDGTMRLVSAAFKDSTDGSKTVERSLRATGRGWLEGVEVDAASMRQLDRSIRADPGNETLRWLATSISDGRLFASSDNQPGQPGSYQCVISNPDGSKTLLGVIASRHADSSMQLSTLLLGEERRALTSEATDEQARLNELNRTVIESKSGSDSQLAYSETATFLNFWMHKTGRGGVLDLPGNAMELLEAFRAYVGKTSYLGRNAECVLQALSGNGVLPAAQSRTVDPEWPDWMPDPLGLSIHESDGIRIQQGAVNTFLVICHSWKPLLELFDRTTIIKLATHATASTLLRFLIEDVSEWRQAGFSDRQIVKFADNDSIGNNFRFVRQLLPAVGQGRLKTTDVMEVVSLHSKADRSKNLNNLLKIASSSS